MQNLTAAEMESRMEEIFSGKLSDVEIIRFLTLLRDKKETAEEVAGAVTALRKKAIRLPCKSRDVMDTCGTGGDGKNTFNISTAAAFIVAGAGVPVAKHGNRAVSSRAGSADVLKALGVNVEASADCVARCVDEVGIGFLFAPLYHPAFKAVAGARKTIGTKTIFNILGPLLNPAGAKKQVIGVYEKRLLPLVAETLLKLGAESAAVVHGEDGLDEVSMAAPTRIYFLKEGKIREEIFSPRDVGYAFCKPEDLAGGDAEENAKRLRRVLKGHSLPLDHCVHLNAALAILVYGAARDFKDALLKAQGSVSSGKAYEKLEALIEMTNKN
ncbi:MAG: anthranilate phosphoribosyltransferase [Deltaproteobacteria bacterium]|nr:anthranilate phosphoribosyltransferase [Deltaproteobacteria bacterium]